MDEIRNVIAETLQISIEIVAEDSSPATLPQWDSLAHFDLVMALENHFKVKFTLDEIIELQSVATIRQLIQKKKDE
jgi:acyl carrier protein